MAVGRKKNKEFKKCHFNVVRFFTDILNLFDITASHVTDREVTIQLKKSVTLNPYKY